jgi:glucosamine--fructose-6-phosphate aminotransferase (isomerizing)
MNDGEICVHAVEKYYDQLGDMVEAIRKGCGDLKGDYAFAAMHKDDNKVYAVKMGSSLFVGIGEDETCVSSDLPSILPVTRQILNIHDGEMVILSPEKVEIRRISDGEPIDRKPYTSDADIRVAQKGGYPHFMLKEIHEQVSTIRTLFTTVVGSYYFNDLANIAAIPVIGGQFNSLYGDSVGNGDVVVCVSQSGETKDVIDVVHLCKKKNVKILGVINVLGSTLTHLSDLYLPMGSGFEISVPATKTYTTQVTLFAFLATLAGQKLGIIKPKAADALINDLQTRLPALLEETISTTTLKARTLAPYLSKFSHFYVLGHGLTHGVALEGALKIKEVCYIVADGMYSSEFKHGPLSIVEKGYPIIFTIAPDDAEHIVNHLAEVECRGARIIATGDDHPLLRRYVREEDFLIVPKSSQYLSPILQAIPLQLIAYHLATYKNIDPDYPRNISKTLTVR